MFRPWRRAATEKPAPGAALADVVDPEHAVDDPGKTNTGYDNVYYLTPEEEAVRIKNALKHSGGFTVEELRAQAKAGKFASYEAKSVRE